jgi:hypothetical protein
VFADDVDGEFTEMLQFSQRDQEWFTRGSSTYGNSILSLVTDRVNHAQQHLQINTPPSSTNNNNHSTKQDGDVYVRSGKNKTILRILTTYDDEDNFLSNGGNNNQTSTEQDEKGTLKSSNDDSDHENENNGVVSVSPPTNTSSSANFPGNHNNNNSSITSSTPPPAIGLTALLQPPTATLNGSPSPIVSPPSTSHQAPSLMSTLLVQRQQRWVFASADGDRVAAIVDDLALDGEEAAETGRRALRMFGMHGAINL